MILWGDRELFRILQVWLDLTCWSHSHLLIYVFGIYGINLVISCLETLEIETWKTNKLLNYANILEGRSLGQNFDREKDKVKSQEPIP